MKSPPSEVEAGGGGDSGGGGGLLGLASCKTEERAMLLPMFEVQTEQSVFLCCAPYQEPIYHLCFCKVGREIWIGLDC